MRRSSFSSTTNRFWTRTEFRDYGTLLQHVDEPLKVLVRRADPEEVDLIVFLVLTTTSLPHLLASDVAVSARSRVDDEIHQGRRVRGDTDSSSDQYGDVV